MFKTIRRAFQMEDIRKRLLFTFLMLLVVRLGSELPAPGINPEYVQGFFASMTMGAFNIFDAFTGGSFSQMSVFALSITPYITASIIIQLLTVAIPRLEEMQKEGEDGRNLIKKITRYLTVGLAVVESLALVIGFGRQGLLVEYNAVNVLVAVVTLTAGSTFLMWIGERITERGIGNGISFILLVNILSRIPSDFITLYQTFVEGKSVGKGILASAIILLIILLVVVFVVLLQSGERRIAVQYSQKIQGRKTYGGQSSTLPLKVNTAGVIPVIFASSLMQTPIVIASFLGKGNGDGIGSQILKGLNQSNWFNLDQPIYTLGLILYILLTVFFAYFYTSITFNPTQVADNMKKRGGFIPGIRPGKPTVEYLQRILKYLIFMGVCGLIIVQVIPFFFSGAFGANVSFAGTSLIIIVGVVLETIKQIESKMVVRNYEGFLNAK